MRHAFILSAALFAILTGPFAHAFNPPVDKAGPLTVRIDAPDMLSEVDTPVPFQVVFENASDEEIKGSLRLKGIDRFSFLPAAKVAFSVEPKGTAKIACTVTAGKGSYTAFYPIHAYVEFEADGKTLSAHPIKILETQFPRTPTAKERDRSPWLPAKVRKDSALKLYDSWTRRTVYQVFGEKDATVSRVGFNGENPRHHGSCMVREMRAGRKETPDGVTTNETRVGFFMHPPWKDGLTGTTVLEFPLALPEGTPLKLTFANAMAPDTQGDGITFRVRAVPFDAPDGELGKVVYENHTSAKTWQEAEVDLSAFGGKAIRLQLETHPGPKNNTSWDHGFWAEPLLITGTPKPPTIPSAATLAEGDLLGTIRRGSRNYDVRVQPGERGLLDATVGFLAKDALLWFRDFQVRVLGELLSDRGAPSPITVTRIPGKHAGELAVRHRVVHPAGEFDVVGRLWVEDNVLRARFDLESGPKPEPWFHVHLQDTAVGEWQANPRRIYAGAGNVMVGVKRGFNLGFDGHRCSTSFVGLDFDNLTILQAVDIPPRGLTARPNGRHCSLHAAHPVTFTFIPHDNALEAAKAWRDVNGLKASGGVQKAAGRFVFDLWGGHYGPSAKALQKSFRYGLTDAMVVWHNWQRWGYDYRLPNITPPNPRFGTTEEMIDLVETCKRQGVPFAPHDNYIDFYPDADGFSYEKTIAFHDNRLPIRAWLNEGRGAQSYRYRADAIEPFLKPNVAWIKEHLKPTGYFIDVWSSAAPYDYWTAQGEFHSALETGRVWAESFDWIRETLGGDAPMISESGHDGLIGHLDAAQTNHLRVGNPIPGQYYTWSVWNVDCEDAERIPWFDIAHHDRFILHGAGYAPRYAAGLSQALHGIHSDDYVCTEILTGHPGMVPRPFGRDVVRKYWLTQDWSRAIAMQTIESMEFVDGDIHRQHVRWSNGAEARVNRGPNDWTVEGRILPEYGFFVKAPGEDGPIEASIERLGGTIVETATAPNRLYVNGRMLMHPPASIRPVVENFRHTKGRTCEFDLVWNATTPIPEGYVPFLHFSDGKGKILFQASQQPQSFDDGRKGELRRKVRVSVPEELPADEEFDLGVGFYRPGTGKRLELDLVGDGSRRYKLGSVRVEEGQDAKTQVRWTGVPLKENTAHSRDNVLAKPIDFGTVATAGACRIDVDRARSVPVRASASESEVASRRSSEETPDGVTTNGLLITPLPAEKGPTATLCIQPEKLGWQLGPLDTVEARDIDGKLLSKRPVERKNGEIVLTIEPGVFQYRIGK